jgi:predicted membrane-bound mannosyltransferase/DNA-binding beta-propeller fold protein YncE
MAAQTNHNSSETGIERFLQARFVLNWEVLVIIAIFLLAVFTRFYMVGDRVMSHDESLHTRFSHDLYADGRFQHTPLMHGPILFHFTALSYTLFGDNDFTARIYTSVLGTLLVMMPLLFRRWLGRWGAILASVMMLISPLMLYYGRYIREDTPAIFTAVLMIWAIFMYLDGPEHLQRRARWIYLTAIAMIWNLGSKETAFIYIAIIGIFLFLYFVVRLLQHYLGLPGKTIFHTGMIGMLLGGVMSMGMYIILDIIKFDMIAPGEMSGFGSLPVSYQSIFWVWTALALGIVILITIGSAMWVYRENPRRIPWVQIAIVIAVALVVCLGFVVLEELSHTDPTSAQPAVPANPDAEGVEVVSGTGIRWMPMIALWIVTIAGFVFLFLVRRRRVEDGDEKDKSGRGFWGTCDLFPEFDLIIVIGTLILPWATALIPYFMKGSAADFTAIANSLPAGMLTFMQTYVPRIGTPDQVGQFMLQFMAWLPLMALSFAFGLSWNWRQWLMTWVLFHGIFAFFFTTVFTNIAGLATGMVYSLGYWLEQQGVRRGSQPQYYYMLIIMPFYEFLPVIGGVASMLTGMGIFWGWRKKNQDLVREQRRLLMGEADNAGDFTDTDTRQADVDAILSARPDTRLERFPFLIFFSWLAVLNLIAYSLAGEKMPWLGTHLTFPLIFLAGWFFGRIINRVDVPALRRSGWVVIPVMLIFLVGLVQTILPLVAGNRPFGGLSKEQLEATYLWIGTVVLAGAALSGIWYLSERVGWRMIRHTFTMTAFGVLALLTFRSAWLASFVNYDYVTEYLVYAHGAPGIKWVLDEIEHLSLQATDGYDLRIAYDNEVSWPFSWYFRDYNNVTYVGENPTVQNLTDAVVVVVGAANRAKVEPILEDRYVRFDHIRLWWPMQEYFNLTPDRIDNLLNFSAENTQAAQIRQGIFNIWWNRDYTLYGTATDRDYTISQWPVSDRMHFYVRRDFAAQVWSYGTGEGGVLNPLTQVEINQCTANWQDLTAVAVLQPAEALANPIGVAVAPDGQIFVAEEFGHRVSVFAADGQYVGQFGRQGSETASGDLQFNRPNGIAIAADGTLVLADTWNYRIQVLNANQELVTSWGQPGTFGFEAPMDPVDAFWGPRAVTIDNAGRVYVADTGNKRVRVYQLQDGVATHVMDIGSGGSGDGQLDEPSGLVLHPDGRLFVADTWNRRISVFNPDGSFAGAYRVRGWYEEQGNRPYLAIDAQRELLYVTDPDSGRVLVYTTAGDCVGSFGQAAGTTPTLGQFGITSGVAVDRDGFVYVADNRLGRVLKFAPFPYSATSSEQEQAAPEVTESSE